MLLKLRAVEKGLDEERLGPFIGSGTVPPLGEIFSQGICVIDLDVELRQLAS